jgi:hypothetical protein
MEKRSIIWSFSRINDCDTIMKNASVLKYASKLTISGPDAGF